MRRRDMLIMSDTGGARIWWSTILLPWIEIC
nr:MAG TPA: hypothetical protein [Caudoviricetes sp.]